MFNVRCSCSWRLHIVLYVRPYRVHGGFSVECQTSTVLMEAAYNVECQALLCSPRLQC